MSLGLGKCPHRPWQVALAIEDKEDLVAYFALRHRCKEHDKWVLDNVITIPRELPVPYLPYPEVCVGCNRVLSTSGSRLWWGCSECGKRVQRSGFYYYLLELKLSVELLDSAYAIAMEAISHERDHSK